MKLLYFLDTDHRMVSRIIVQMLGPPPLSWPINEIICRLVMLHVLLLRPWSVLSRYLVPCMMKISISAALGVVQVIGTLSLREEGL